MSQDNEVAVIITECIRDGLHIEFTTAGPYLMVIARMMRCDGLETEKMFSLDSLSTKAGADATLAIMLEEMRIELNALPMPNDEPPATGGATPTREA